MGTFTVALALFYLLSDVNLMMFDNRIGECAWPRRPSCRDKGWMRGWVGALCLSSWQYDAPGFREAQWTYPNEDKHKAPSSAPPRSLSLQKTTPFSPLPYSVVKHHKNGAMRFTDFSYQKGERVDSVSSFRAFSRSNSSDSGAGEVRRTRVTRNIRRISACKALHQAQIACRRTISA